MGSRRRPCVARVDTDFGRLRLFPPKHPGALVARTQEISRRRVTLARAPRGVAVDVVVVAEERAAFFRPMARNDGDPRAGEARGG